MDLMSSNSGNTLDKMINASLILYSSSKDETVFIDYGDNSVQTLNITLG